MCSPGSCTLSASEVLKTPKLPCYIGYTQILICPSKNPCEVLINAKNVKTISPSTVRDSTRLGNLIGFQSRIVFRVTTAGGQNYFTFEQRLFKNAMRALDGREIFPTDSNQL